MDIYWSGRLPGSGAQATKLIETSIPLVAVDQSSDVERSSAMIARTVTVEATPTQVAALATAQNSGRLSLALVGRNDDTVVSDVEVDQQTLLGIVQQQVVEAPKERVCTIRTRKGGEIIDTPIPCTN